MDNFLVNLYNENLDKLAEADYSKLLNSLSVKELELLLGIPKVAVAGTDKPEEPTGEAAAEAKVTQQALPKQKGPAELPDGKVEEIKHASVKKEAGPLDALKGGFAQGSAALKGMAQPGGQAVSAFSKSRVIPGMQALVGEGAHAGAKLAPRLGFAARMLGPHALGIGALAYGAHKMLSPSQPKYAQAEYLLMAARAVKNSPANIKTAAAKMVVQKIAGPHMG